MTDRFHDSRQTNESGKIQLNWIEPSNSSNSSRFVLGVRSKLPRWFRSARGCFSDLCEIRTNNRWRQNEVLYCFVHRSAKWQRERERVKSRKTSEIQQLKAIGCTRVNKWRKKSPVKKKENASTNDAKSVTGTTTKAHTELVYMSTRHSFSNHEDGKKEKAGAGGEAEYKGRRWIREMPIQTEHAMQHCHNKQERMIIRTRRKTRGKMRSKKERTPLCGGFNSNNRNKKQRNRQQYTSYVQSPKFPYLNWPQLLLMIHNHSSSS